MNYSFIQEKHHITLWLGDKGLETWHNKWINKNPSPKQNIRNAKELWQLLQNNLFYYGPLSAQEMYELLTANNWDVSRAWVGAALYTMNFEGKIHYKQGVYFV